MEADGRLERREAQGSGVARQLQLLHEHGVELQEVRVVRCANAEGPDLAEGTTQGGKQR